MLTRDYEVPDRLACTCHIPSSDSHYAPRLATVALETSFNDILEPISLLSVLVDALPKGLIVLSTDHAVIYWNQTAKRLCQNLSGAQRYWTLLPKVITELCDQVLASEHEYEPILLEYQTPECSSFRLTASWLATASSDNLHAAINHQPYILITVEDRDEVLRQEIQMEQKKFQLTNREAEVWLLLKQEYSYQAIAKALHISLNTVKTHIRNIHAKRNPYQSLPA
ncbi:MAG: helix-turn-helix transcriptional regulator [Stenomitos rutilans HA7619-LM2]|jgi:DNA-binding CsgD family transcriptional regulator|nr:helix-turn-helix transcriptional regulator [Stenomitos rutilans HA7619-LM2]